MTHAADGRICGGTNTAAYRMAKIVNRDKLPMRLPRGRTHFAVGDTCYSHEEDNVSYNPDGKRLLQGRTVCICTEKRSVEKAYLNCPFRYYDPI